MDKTLFHDQPLLTRRQFLEDNCSEVEQITYTRDFDETQMNSRKTELANVDIQIEAILEEKQEYLEMLKERLKPLKTQRADLLSDIKRGYEEVTEPCYKFIDRDSRETGYYNAAGDLVRQRPMNSAERQINLFEGISKTGTDD